MLPAFPLKYPLYSTCLDHLFTCSSTSAGSLNRHVIFPVQLTTSRIGNLTRLIHTLLYVMTIHTYTYMVESRSCNPYSIRSSVQSFPRRIEIAHGQPPRQGAGVTNLPHSLAWASDGFDKQRCVDSIQLELFFRSATRINDVVVQLLHFARDTTFQAVVR